MWANRNPGPWLLAQLLQRRRAIFTVVLLIGCLLSAGVLLDGWRRMRREIEEAFRKDAAETFATLREEIEEAVNSAASVAEVFHAVGPVTRGQFHSLALPHLTRCGPGLLALIWAPRVLDGGRAKGIGRRLEHFPISYLESLSLLDNSWIVGQDLGAAPVTLEALRRTRDTREPALTAAIPLTIGGTEAHAYWAVYRQRMPQDYASDRRGALLGFVGAIFRIDQLVESALEEAHPRGIEVTLVDDTGSESEQVLHTHQALPGTPPRSWAGQRLMEGWIRAGLRWTGPLEVGGRRWGVFFTPAVGYVGARVSAEMWGRFLLGLGITAFVGGYLLLLMRRTDAVEREVAARTRELQRAHDLLVAEVGERTRAEAVARRLTQRVLTVQEEERRRLSRELHDQAGQSLTGLMLTLQLLQADLPHGQAALRQRLHEAQALSRQTAELIRLQARDLRPPALDTLGLDASLRGLCSEVARRTGLSIGYTGSDVPPLPDTATICLYRILQESLTNVVKHAGARQVRVALQDDAEAVTLSVEDDGCGFDSWIVGPLQDSSRGNGILGMRERLELLGGRLEIASRPGQGARVVAQIPATEGEPCVDLVGALPHTSR